MKIDLPNVQVVEVTKLKRKNNQNIRVEDMLITDMNFNVKNVLIFGV